MFDNSAHVALVRALPGQRVMPAECHRHNRREIQDVLAKLEPVAVSPEPASEAQREREARLERYRRVFADTTDILSPGRPEGVDAASTVELPCDVEPGDTATMAFFEWREIGTKEPPQIPWSRPGEMGYVCIEADEIRQALTTAVRIEWLQHTDETRLIDHEGRHVMVADTHASRRLLSAFEKRQAKEVKPPLTLSEVLAGIAKGRKTTWTSEEIHQAYQSACRIVAQCRGFAIG